MNGSVAHVVPALFGPGGIVGGAERYAFELARHMAETTPTTLVTFGDRERVDRIGALNIHILGGAWHIRGQRTNPFHLRLFRALRDASVVHCHQQHVLASSAVAAWCKATGRRVFVSDLGGGGWDISAYISTDRWFDGHLHISQYSRHIYGHDGNPRARVVGGGVDTIKFSPEPAVPRDRGPLFVGRLLPHKGITDLVQAVPARLPLTIVGPVPDESMKCRLVQLTAGKTVIFKHGLNDAALVDEYRRALCVVLPSVYRTPDGRETLVPELLGQTLLEGMACATPAVCTRVASMPEVVEDGVNGFVVPPNDPERLADRLAWLQTHADAAQVMGIAGRRRVLDRFTWSAVVGRCLDAYHERHSGWFSKTLSEERQA